MGVIRFLAKILWAGCAAFLGWLVYESFLYETDPEVRWGDMVLYTMVFFGCSLVLYPLSRIGRTWRDWDSAEDDGDSDLDEDEDEGVIVRDDDEDQPPPSIQLRS